MIIFLFFGKYVRSVNKLMQQYSPIAWQSGCTPLHEAAWSGQTNCIELLVSLGADINAKNKVLLPNVCNIILSNWDVTHTRMHGSNNALQCMKRLSKVNFTASRSWSTSMPTSMEKIRHAHSLPSPTTCMLSMHPLCVAYDTSLHAEPRTTLFEAAIVLHTELHYNYNHFI